MLYFAVNSKKKGAGVLMAYAGMFAALFMVFKYRAGAFAITGFMPLGMSFYILRAVHCIFESYKEKLPSGNFIDLACYMFFMPTILAGPVNRYEQFVRDLRRRRWDAPLFSTGLERILFGYFKVVLLAGYLVDNKFAMLYHQSGLSGFLRVYADSVISWMSLYLQFSGYSDIAIGFSALAGFRIIENFNFPFLATNIIDFWKRWHISLTLWCRDYVYRPVLSFTRRPFLSICIAMVVLGLWHELSLRYILWGVYHAAGIAVYHNFRKIRPGLGIFEKGLPGKIAGFSGWFITINFVILSYPVTRFAQTQIDLYFKEIVRCILS